ncbi:hypothetical protein ABXN37_01595 [Piscinibacter sakaiensis]
MRLGPVAGRAWRTRVVVPRALCVFESLPTTGVAWHERAAFARLQVLRLVPYARTQACAVVKAGRLMLWLWDADEVAAALRAEGLAPQRVRVLPETLLLPLPAADGAWIDRAQALAAGADLEPLLGRLQPVLEAQGLSMREFELRNDDLRITLASGGPGVEIDLPRALAALSALPGLEAVQLRQSSEPQLAAFVMKVPGFRRAAFDRAEDRR